MTPLTATLFLLFLQLFSTGCEKKKLLIGGMFPMSGGWAGGIGCLPATQLALHDVNKNESLLQDYELELVQVDSKCMPGLSLKKMYDLLYDNETKLILLTGCSSVSTFVAQAAHMWNLTVLSYGSSSPALSDRQRFPTFFRTHPSATLNNPTRLMLFKKYGWQRIATLQQTEEVFTSTIKNLEEVIKAGSSVDAPIEITVRQSFQTDPSNAVKSLKMQDARIIVGVFYEDMARKVFCEAYREKLYGKKYVWLIIGWYPDLWYMKPDPDVDCTPEQLKIALEGHLTTEVVQYNLNGAKVTDTGITTNSFLERLETVLQKLNGSDDSASLSSLAGFVEAPLAYDAIWALSFALNKTIGDLKIKGLSLEDFTYQDSVTKDTILDNLNKTDFEGVSGRVSFTSTGDRIAKIQIEQMQNGIYRKIGVYDYMSDDLTWQDNDDWEDDHPPADRTLIIDKLRKISKLLLYIMVVLSSVGVIFSVSAILFNICSLRYSIVRNSLPCMNTLIACGCIICLACVPLFGIDGEWASVEKYPTFCQVRTWMIMIGFTLSYGTMFVKVVYSWQISKISKESKAFKNAAVQPDSVELLIPKWKPYSLLASLLALDLIILIVWQKLDPLKRIVDSFPTELPDASVQSDIKFQPLLERCSSKHMTAWIGITYGYKGFLLIVGLFLAYETRNVKIRAINDLRLLAMAVYNIVVLCLIAVPVTLIIPNQHNARFAFVSVATIISCVLTVALLFIPKMLPILSNRLDMDEEETQKSLLNHENEKRYDELKKKNERIKQEISQKENQIQKLHAALQRKYTTQLSSEDQGTSDSAFCEDNSKEQEPL
ncbi:gamma-aminobutyric acid type B receptor subunit 1-like [Watersipora subatra]|uniref:gamma-aminobutyric acid type B receptor subunit 1-like n=1 Tax=Watersipora subatra TaxID=2589382 RepID=UPI00355B8C1B